MIFRRQVTSSSCECIYVFFNKYFYALSESVGKLFSVYRIKLTETVDLEKDQEAKCREYSRDNTYRDCLSLQNAIKKL